MLDNDCPFSYDTDRKQHQPKQHQPKAHQMNTSKVVEEFEKEFLKKENSFPRVKPEDISVFDFDNRIVKNGIIYLDGKTMMPVGNIIIGQHIIRNADIMRGEVHRARYKLISHSQDDVSFEKE